MHDHIVNDSRDQSVFLYENTLTKDRVWTMFLYNAGLSYRRVETVPDHSWETVRQWYHRLAHLF